MLSATCPYAACNDGYKFMDTLRAQIRFCKATFKSEFQCRAELFKFLQAFQVFHNTHFEPVRPANSDEHGRAKQLLDTLKQQIGDGTFRGDPIREILEVVFPNGSGVWFTLDQMKSMLPVMYSILWTHVQAPTVAPNSWAPVIEQATPVVQNEAPVIEQASPDMDDELKLLLDIKLNPLVGFIHEDTPAEATLGPDTFDSGISMVDRKNNANLVRAMFESGLSYEDQQISSAFGGFTNMDPELAAAIEQSEMEEAIRRSLAEGPMDLDN